MPLSQLASAFPESAHALAMAGNDAFAQGRRQEAAEGELAIAALSAKSDQELAMASSQFQTLQEGSDNEDELQAQGAAHFEASLSADPEHFGHVRGYVIELLQPPSPAAQRARAEGVLVEVSEHKRAASRASAGLMGLSCVAVVAGRGRHPRRRKGETHLRSRRRGGGSDPGRACPRARAYQGGGGAGRGVQDPSRMPRPMMGGGNYSRVAGWIMCAPHKVCHP